MKKLALICIVWILSTLCTYGQRYIGMTFNEAQTYINERFEESGVSYNKSGTKFIYGFSGYYMVSLFFHNGICDVWRSCVKDASFNMLKSNLVSLGYINVGSNVFINENIIAKISYDYDLRQYVITMTTNN